MIEAAGAAVKQVGADMIGGRPPVKGPFKAINFMVYAPRAQADASTDGRVMHLSYDAMELRHAVHMGMDGDAILAGGTDLGWWSPSNDDIIADYCTTRQGGAFCSRVAAD
ncbi:hypothetical protein [Novosphingobium sp. CF614]|uniref:hypothetical protein n=1 Tax=Novosphingobium sp. CF614 TaxID=1884364 RepID=UPI000B88244F|nr:hypothetical protein [Novosphingobium sp. CF614]